MTTYDGNALGTNKIKLYRNNSHVDGEDKLPVLTGLLNIEGKEFRVALWKTKGGLGDPVLRGEVEPYELLPMF